MYLIMHVHKIYDHLLIINRLAYMRLHLRELEEALDQD